jgi:hypothetical protein
MAGVAPAGADPFISPTEALAQRAQRLPATLLFPAQPFAAPSAAHDAGLRALDLLHFVRLDLSVPGAPRPDLVAELIANYRCKPGSDRGWSSVRGKRIEVSSEALAIALCLPVGRATTSRSAAGDPAVVASAAQEFAKVYILQRGVKDAALRAVEEGRAHDIDWTGLIWRQVKVEIKVFMANQSADRVCYHGAHLQRLIWVQRPELFRRPLEERRSNHRSLVGDMQRPTLFQLRPQQPEERGIKRAAANENQKCCLEFNMQEDRPRPQQINLASKKYDAASKNFDAASERFIVASKNFFPASMMTDAKSKQIDMAAEGFDVASKKLDMASKMMDAVSRMIEATSKQLDARGKQIGEQKGKLDARAKHMGEKEGKLDARAKHLGEQEGKLGARAKQLEEQEAKLHARAKQLGEQEGKLDARAKQLGEQEGKLDARAKQLGDQEGKLDAITKQLGRQGDELDATAEQLGEKEGDMQAMELLNSALVTKERESNDELQCARKMLIEVTEQLTHPLWMHAFDTSKDNLTIFLSFIMHCVLGRLFRSLQMVGLI